MRNKLKKIWNKEDGFTLVELLGVIVILGIILAIAVPGIGKIIDNADKKTAEQQELLVIDAAQMYFLNEDVAEDATVTPAALVTAGYLEDKGTYADNTTSISKTDAESGVWPGTGDGD